MRTAVLPAQVNLHSMQQLLRKMEIFIATTLKLSNRHDEWTCVYSGNGCRPKSQSPIDLLYYNFVSSY